MDAKASTAGRLSNGPWLERSNSVRNLLGIVVVVGGVVAVLATWTLRGAADSERLAAFLVAPIGAVLGFYFGRQGIDQAAETAADAVVAKRDAEGQLERLIEEVLDMRRDLARVRSEFVSDADELPRKLDEPGGAIE